MAHFLVFAGTTEGRRLIEWLDECGASVCASVATEYGKILLPETVQVFADRLDAEQMVTLMQSLSFDCVIDATHPYAALVTGNIRAACAAAQVRYLRLIRPSSAAEGCVYVEDAQAAAEVLCATTGKVLLTTGSKELDIFTCVPDYQNRLCPRVLAGLESLQRCLALGYKAQNIVSMQGPFSREMNCATIRQLGAKILVTKESGETGGFSEKLSAAHDTGVTAIVIGRPREESGLEYTALCRLLEVEYRLIQPVQEQPLSSKQAWLPVFLDLSRLSVAVFGGGSAALRRVSSLAGSCGELTVISPQLHPELESSGATIIRRSYLRGDCSRYAAVFAANENRDLNRAIYEECHAANIPVNVADSTEESDFYFPCVVRTGDFVAGVAAVAVEQDDEKLAGEAAQRIGQQLMGLLCPPEKQEENA